MDKDLSIQEVRQLAAYKTGDINITDSEAVSVINSVMPGFNLKEVNPLSMDKSYFVPAKLDENQDSSGFIFNNMLEKLGLSKKEDISIFPAKNVQPAEPSDDEMKFFAIDFLREDSDRALQLFNAQRKNQGYISSFYSEIKDIFNTDLSASQVSRILAEEELDARLLELAGTEQLSEKDYLQAKLDLAVRLLGEDSGNAEKYRKGLASLEPKDLTRFINRVLSLSDTEYNQEIPRLKENILN